nr:PREDICTED: high affinity cAMP-specific and IBMX-insensitive 3',5'-cyclic phosphodiesterase 8B [Bemisia tabaci]XP_018914697.1 PREDICTED: high affinity cAMP-specific and IBMX-insensitive 3',5'-cyclic phosphodiesterase 8B [Bemisia tabaci]XP_018914698.1 PREDICTED: high affinity cAMP-specific and IBMX-insensitive 3',5'-cyclic phosphodiesterase 8B [Bemisia tabaci]XP_018914699.1 PREDICTED: high affinity cAMP-specific and IBMX-insensitive 3',5'-cyclic phosphodiesterase 8B [Bemisia tabaci]
MGCSPSSPRKKRSLELSPRSASDTGDLEDPTGKIRDHLVANSTSQYASEQQKQCWGCCAGCPLLRSSPSQRRHNNTSLKVQASKENIVEDEGNKIDAQSIVIDNFNTLTVLLATSREDGVFATLKSTIESLGYCLFTAATEEATRDVILQSNPQVVFIDLRQPNFRGDHICKFIRAIKKRQCPYLIAVMKRRGLEKDKKDVKLALKYGYNRVILEPLTENQCLSELVQLAESELPLHSALTQNEAVFASLDKTRDLVLVTDANHSIQFVNKAMSHTLGYSRSELLGKQLPSVHQIGSMDMILRHLERGFDWEGKVSWKAKSGDNIVLQCRASPFRTSGKTNSHYIYIQDNPSDGHALPRGSVPSIRKGSYDLKSINSEGAQSARRQSLAKLHNLPLEAPITRVISLICSAQENSSDHVVQILDKVMDILRTTELYSSHLKADNIRCDDPVTSDLIGALISQGPAPVSTTRRSSNDSAAVKSQTLVPSTGGGPPGLRSTPYTLAASPQLKELLEGSLAWDFNIFKLEDLSGKRPLAYLGMNILLHFEVHKTLGCDERTLHSWLVVMERHYHSHNTYHNSTHAADVLQATAVFLEREHIKRHLDGLDEACCLIAAATHDIDHPGKSSLFLINSGDDLAILYNDISVLESHHAALTFKLTLKDDRINIFKGLEHDTYKVARQSIVDMILATEMTKHFEHLAKFVSVFNKTGSTSLSDDAPLGDCKSPSEMGADLIWANSPDELNLMKRMMIKCADVSNPTRPLTMCVEWARRIAEEYFTQTDDEKANKLPVVMPQFDRTTCSIPKSQMGFVDFIINDMFEAWDAFIDMPEMLYHMRSNYQHWKDLEERGVTSLGDACGKSLPGIPETNNN